jgi:SAM-dependent methyltransferase
MPMSDPYEEIAHYYDAENADLVEDLAAYTLLAERFGGPVLDVGCGTARVALHLADQDFAVTGIESSTAMLEHARAKPRIERVKLIEGSAVDVQAGEAFGLAVLAFSTFQHFHAQDEQLRVLANIARHLRPGGGIVLDLSNPVHFFRTDDNPALIHERTFTDPVSNQPVMQQSIVRADRAAQILNITWIYDRIEADGSITRTTCDMPLRCYTAPEIRLLLERTGFSPVEFYGTFEFDPFDEHSPRLFVVAEKVP